MVFVFFFFCVSLCFRTRRVGDDVARARGGPAAALHQKTVLCVRSAICSPIACVAKGSKVDLRADSVAAGEILERLVRKRLDEIETQLASPRQAAPSDGGGGGGGGGGGRAPAQNDDDDDNDNTDDAGDAPSAAAAAEPPVSVLPTRNP